MRMWCKYSPASAWFQTGSLPAARAFSDTGLSHAPLGQLLHPVKEKTEWHEDINLLVMRGTTQAEKRWMSPVSLEKL